MIILTIRTDKPEAELGIFDNDKELAYLKWQAHRGLAETIHKKIDEILFQADKKLLDIEGLVFFAGPGSFTGLRIGASVANALAYGLKIPIVAETGQDWISRGIKKIRSGQNDKVVLPKYGAAPFTTKQSK